MVFSSVRSHEGAAPLSRDFISADWMFDSSDIRLGIRVKYWPPTGEEPIDRILNDEAILTANGTVQLNLNFRGLPVVRHAYVFGMSNTSVLPQVSASDRSTEMRLFWGMIRSMCFEMPAWANATSACQATSSAENSSPSVANTGLQRRIMVSLLEPAAGCWDIEGVVVDTSGLEASIFQGQNLVQVKVMAATLATSNGVRRRISNPRKLDVGTVLDWDKDQGVEAGSRRCIDIRPRERNHL